MSPVAARAAVFTVVTVTSAVVATLVGAAPASAHAHLVRVSPADGATVTTAPTRVVLTFDETIRATSTVIVTGPDGRQVQRGGTRVVNNIASVEVTPGRSGAHTVAFRVVSADGHPETGRTTFTYLPTGASTPAGSTAARHVHQQDAGTSTGLVAGGVAFLALLGGVVLLTGRRDRGARGSR